MSNRLETQLTKYLKSTGKRKKVRIGSPEYNLRNKYATQRITRFMPLDRPDQNTRNRDFTRFLYDRFVDEREGHEYYGILPDEVTTESLTYMIESDPTAEPEHLRGDLAYLRKIPYLKNFTEDELRHRPLVELFGVSEDNEDRDYNDIERDGSPDAAVVNRVSPEHVPGHVPWQRGADPWLRRVARAPRMYGRQWLTLTEDHFAAGARYIPIPTVLAPKFIVGDELFTLEPIQPGELIVEIKCGAHSVYLLRESFDGYVNTPHAEQGPVLKHPVYQQRLAGCNVRQFEQPAAARAAQSKKPRKNSRARKVSRKMFRSRRTPVTIDLTGPDVVDLSSSP